MANLIEKSHDIARRFSLRAKACEESELDGSRIRNMKFCKPRFNSSSQPLGRSILFNDASIGLAVEVSTEGHDTAPAHVSQQFLGDISEEVYVQPGMMADAGDETVVVQGCFDIGDKGSLASMPSDIHQLLKTSTTCL